MARTANVFARVEPEVKEQAEQVQIKVILFIKSIKMWMLFLKFTEKKIMVFDFWFWELVLCQDLVQVKKTKYLLLEQTHYTSESPVRYFFMKKL